MESTVFDFETLKNSPKFGIKVYADAIYRGELQDGKRNGLGAMIYKKHRVYEGFWAGDHRNG